MATVLDIRRRKVETIDEMVAEIKRQFLIEQDAGRKLTSSRVCQGQLLLDLRARVEADGGDWWKFFDDQFAGFHRSRKDAEKVMRMAAAEDPEAAHEQEKAEAKERMRRVRGANVRSTADVMVDAYADIDDDGVCHDCDTEEDFWRRALEVAAGNSIAMTDPITWKKKYGDWEHFDVPSALIKLAEQAADGWATAVRELKASYGAKERKMRTKR
jgi:hypothetical protein